MTWYIKEKLTANKSRQLSFRTQRELMEYAGLYNVQLERINRIEYVVIGGTFEVA